MTARCLLGCGQDIPLGDLADHQNQDHPDAGTTRHTDLLIALDEHLVPVAVVSARTGAVA